MKQRLEQFLSAENLTQAQFADSINVARAGVSHILAGRNNPSYEFIVNTMKMYPNLNIEWLLNGTGRMYKSDRPREDMPSYSLFSEPKPSEPIPDEKKTSSRNINRILVFFSDGTYEEFS